MFLQNRAVLLYRDILHICKEICHSIFLELYSPLSPIILPSLLIRELVIRKSSFCSTSTNLIRTQKTAQADSLKFNFRDITGVVNCQNGERMLKRRGPPQLYQMNARKKCQFSDFLRKLRNSFLWDISIFKFWQL